MLYPEDIKDFSEDFSTLLNTNYYGDPKNSASWAAENIFVLQSEIFVK